MCSSSSFTSVSVHHSFSVTVSSPDSGLQVFYSDEINKDSYETRCTQKEPTGWRCVYLWRYVRILPRPCHSNSFFVRELVEQKIKSILLCQLWKNLKTQRLTFNFYHHNRLDSKSLNYYYLIIIRYKSIQKHTSDPLIPAEDYCRTWSNTRTIRLRRTSKRVKEVSDKMRLLVVLRLCRMTNRRCEMTGQHAKSLT